MNHEPQVRVMMLTCPRSTSTIFTKAMSTVPGSQIFMDSHYFCHEAELNLQMMGKPVDYDLPDEDWRKAAELIMGEDCSADKVDVSKLKYATFFIKKIISQYQTIPIYGIHRKIIFTRTVLS